MYRKVIEINEDESDKKYLCQISNNKMQLLNLLSNFLLRIFFITIYYFKFEYNNKQNITK